MTSGVERPVLRYHGAKWLIADWVIQHFVPHYAYVEPFGGSAAVLLRKAPSPAEVYNDLDEALVNLFRVLVDPGARDELLRRLYLTPYSRTFYHEAWDLARGGTVDDPIERARLTLIVSWQSRSSAAITRASRPGWRCWAKPGWGQTPADYWQTLEERILPVAERLRAVYLEQKPALDVIGMYDGPDTLLYVDPPYVGETRIEGLGNYRHELSDDEHRELAEVLHGCRGLIAVSGYDSPLYRDLYGDWVCHRTRTQTDGRNIVEECLWLNPALSQLQQPDLFSAAG